MRSLRCRADALCTSAVMPCAAPAELRFALHDAAHSITASCLIEGRSSQPVATAAGRHGHGPPSSARPHHTARSCRVCSPKGCASRCGAAHPAPPLAPNTTCGVSIQWQRRHAAIARPHRAVASACRAARPCPAASRSAWWPPGITAGAQCTGRGFQSAAKAASRHARAPGVLTSAAGGRRFMAQHPRYSHPLRFYIRPHFTKCGAVAALLSRHL